MKLELNRSCRAFVKHHLQGIGGFKASKPLGPTFPLDRSAFLCFRLDLDAFFLL